MKSPNLASTALSVLLLSATVGISRSAVAQVTKPKAEKAASHEKTPAENNITLAWRNVARAYQDLMSVSADVKGDTSRLEAAIAAAVDDLHQQDPSLAPASKALGRQDAGVSRETIFGAVEQHLVEARNYINESGIKSAHCQQALVHIAEAQKELNLARSAPVKK